MVETQEQLKDLGLLEIFTLSFKTIFKFNKILSKIALTLILPLTTIFLANLDISNRVFHYHEANPYHMLFQVYKVYGSSYHAEEADLSRHFVYFVYFVLLSIISIAVFYICSTVSVVYTIASIYTGDEVTYTKSTKVVGKVWERVLICFIVMLMYLVLYTLIMAYYDITLDGTFPRILVVFVGYICGYLYLSIVWQLASTISVLEFFIWFEVLRTIIRAMILVKEKMMITFVISFTLYVFFGGVVFMYMALVVHGELWVIWRVLIGIICGVLLMLGFLFNMVIYTILYLVCKSCKGEALDSACLSYLADSQPDEKPQDQPVSKV